jgi:hypothetical protein
MVISNPGPEDHRQNILALVEIERKQEEGSFKNII